MHLMVVLIEPVIGESWSCFCCHISQISCLTDDSMSIWTITKAVIMMMKMTEADKLGLTSFLSGPGHSTRLTRTSMMVARAMMKKTMTMMKKKIHSRRLLLSTHEWSSNDGDYEHYARPGAMITIMMIKQDNFLPKHWLKHYPFDGFLQILFDGGGGGG